LPGVEKEAHHMANESIVKNCPACGGDFTVPYKQRTRKFCGHKCAFSITGEKTRLASQSQEARAKNADSRRGSGRGVSYIKRDGRHEHRAIAEKNLGRPLLPGEIAHHRDENPRNNDPSNIEVLASQAEHASLHFTGKKRPARLVCKEGHPLSGDNVRLDSRGFRRCVACIRTYDNAWKKSRRQEVRHENR
jgi:hypothetical protein